MCELAQEVPDDIDQAAEHAVDDLHNNEEVVASLIQALVTSHTPVHAHTRTCARMHRRAQRQGQRKMKAAKKEVEDPEKALREEEEEQDEREAAETAGRGRGRGGRGRGRGRSMKRPATGMKRPAKKSDPKPELEAKKKPTKRKLEPEMAKETKDKGEDTGMTVLEASPHYLALKLPRFLIRNVSCR